MENLQDLVDHHRSAASPGAYPPLATAIGRATGEKHEVLSNLIIKAMPKGLPPKANNTRLYCDGLFVYGMIYLEFEDCWKQYLESTSTSGQPHDLALRTFLQTVRPKGIERTPRLEEDLWYLLNGGEDDPPSRRVYEQDPEEGPVYKKFKAHIDQAIKDKPHVLYSYAWCMYMAIFAGGYYIRAELAKVDEKFWWRHGWNHAAGKDDGNDIILDRKGYSFLSFDVDEKKLQQDFKARLFGAEAILTSEERDDIIEESKNIFDLSIELVKEMMERITPDNLLRKLRKPSLQSQDQQPSELPTYGETTARLPSYFDANYGDFEKGISATDADGLLTQQATEEEYREWRAEAAPMRRGPLFWTQMVLLVAFLSFVMFGLMFGVRWWAWRRSLQLEDEMGKAAGKPCLGGFSWW